MSKAKPKTESEATKTLVALLEQMNALRAYVVRRLPGWSYNEVAAFEEREIKPLAKRISVARAALTRKRRSAGEP